MNLLAVNWTRDYNVRSWSRPLTAAAADYALWAASNSSV